MIRNKLFVKFICVLLLASFLTLGVGKVQRASAIGTTIATSAAAALCAVGLVYCSYMALTGAAVHVPDTVENIQTWLTDMGSKVVEFPSGREAYQDIYTNHLARSPEGNLIRDFIDSDIWTWTAERLKAWANDFSSTDVIKNIASYENQIDVSTIPLNAFDYPFDIISIPLIIPTWNNLSVDYFTYNWYYSGTRFFLRTSNYTAFVNSDIYGDVRNYYDGEFYYPQQYVNGDWQYLTDINYGYGYTTSNLYVNVQNADGYIPESYARGTHGSIRDRYPLFPDAVIYNSLTGETSTLVIPNSTELIDTPQWPDLPVEDDDYDLPVPIPYVQLPFDPTWIDPITGTGGGGNWGFNLGDLLDKLEDLANTLIQIGIIGDLINDFKNSLTGNPSDPYYIYYDDSENNYYDYYTITNFGDNTQYIYNYNYDVSEVDKHLPVDLNTISIYTNNRYVDTFKRIANSGASIIGDLVVFWHNVDPELIYTLFGCAIITLIAAFIGKWGHS